jgi:quercetin dioxygenase-like cupin family protein
MAAGILGAAALATAAERHHIFVSTDAIRWDSAPPHLSGAQAAVLHGSPSEEGAFVLRLKFPAGFVVPRHRYSKESVLTVISGDLRISAGEERDKASFRTLPPGSFVHLPAGTPYVAAMDVETVVQIYGVGPFDIVSVDPKDDPLDRTEN